MILIVSCLEHNQRECVSLALYRRYDSYGYNERSTKRAFRPLEEGLQTSLKDGDHDAKKAVIEQNTRQSASTNQSTTGVWGTNLTERGITTSEKRPIIPGSNARKGSYSNHNFRGQHEKLTCTKHCAEVKCCIDYYTPDLGDGV
jgi:hypothetical protein